MTKSTILAAMLVLALSAGPCLSEATQLDGKVISEECRESCQRRIVFRHPHAEHAGKDGGILGSQIENGFKRHLEELKLQLIDQGYTIVPDMTANDRACPRNDIWDQTPARWVAPVRLFPPILAR